MYIRIFLSWTGSGFQTISSSPFPKNWWSTPPPCPRETISLLSVFASTFHTIVQSAMYTFLHLAVKKNVMILKIFLFSKHAVTLETTHFMLMTKVNCLKSLVNNTLDHFFFHTTNKKETISQTNSICKLLLVSKRKIWYHELRWNAV